ncbi:MAG: hypothetical protein ACPGQD_03785 [Planctomycetota bacterium]
MSVGGDGVHIGTGGAAVQMLDAATGTYRDSALGDLWTMMRVVDEMPNIHYGLRPLVARDIVDPLELDLNTAFAVTAATAKPTGVSFTSADTVDPVVDLFDLALGGEPEHGLVDTGAGGAGVEAGGKADPARVAAHVAPGEGVSHRREVPAGFAIRVEGAEHRRLPAPQEHVAGERDLAITGEAGRDCDALVEAHRCALGKWEAAAAGAVEEQCTRTIGGGEDQLLAGRAERRLGVAQAVGRDGVDLSPMDPLVVADEDAFLAHVPDAARLGVVRHDPQVLLEEELGGAGLLAGAVLKEEVLEGVAGGPAQAAVVRAQDADAHVAVHPGVLAAGGEPACAAGGADGGGLEARHSGRELVHAGEAQAEVAAAPDLADVAGRTARGHAPARDQDHAVVLVVGREFDVGNQPLVGLGDHLVELRRHGPAGAAVAGAPELPVGGDEEVAGAGGGGLSIEGGADRGRGAVGEDVADLVGLAPLLLGGVEQEHVAILGYRQRGAVAAGRGVQVEVPALAGAEAVQRLRRLAGERVVGPNPGLGADQELAESRAAESRMELDHEAGLGLQPVAEGHLPGQAAVDRDQGFLRGADDELHLAAPGEGRCGQGVGRIMRGMPGGEARQDG